MLFHDDFENTPLGPVVTGWTLSPATNAWAVVADGTHVLSVPGVGLPTATAGGFDWTDYKVSADVKTNPIDGHAHLIARYQSDQYYYTCGLDHTATLYLGKVYGGAPYLFQTAPFVFTAASWYHIDFSVQGTSLTCTVTDPVTKLSATVTDTKSYFMAGKFGATGDKAEFDNFVVTALP